MIDFRKVENRRELLIRYSVWQLRNYDVDTAIPLMQYIFDRNEYNIEQRYWFVFLYANTYDAASALAVWNEMPDKHLVSMDTLFKFNSEKATHIHYERDVKWSKFNLDKMSESYIKLTKDGQHSFFQNLASSEDGIVNYNNVRNTIINQFYKMGRYTAWFYMQALNDLCNVNITPRDCHYGYDCQSPTDGLAMIMGREDLCSRLYVDNGNKKIKQNIIYTPDIINEFNEYSDSIIKEVNSRFPDVTLDYYKLETILCSIKKLFRRRDGRYLGYYLDRLASNVNASRSYWTGVDYSIITDWLFETLPKPALDRLSIRGPVTNRMHEFLDTGTLTGLNDYDDLKNI